MALNSMQEIFERGGFPVHPLLAGGSGNRYGGAAGNGRAVHGKNAGCLACYAGICRQLSGRPALPQRPCGRRRCPDAALRRGGYYIQRPLCAGGHCYGPQRGRVQRLHAEDRGGTNGGRLRRAAGGAGASVPDGPRHRGRDFAGSVYRFRHRRGGQLPGLYRRCFRRLSGGDRHGFRYGGWRADLPAGRRSCSRSATRRPWP